MCTFKIIAVSNWELYQERKAVICKDSYVLSKTKNIEEYAKYLAKLVTVRKDNKITPNILIVREKKLPEKIYIELFSKVLEKCGNTSHASNPCKITEQHKKKLPIVIPHTFLAAAQQTNSNCIHLPLLLFRDYKKTGKLEGITKIGTSIHSLEEAKEAQQLGASYLIAGHIFTTDCKKDVLPRGIEFLEQICNHVHIPVYAIGGIHSENLPQIQNTKAAGACMMSEFFRE